MKELFMTLQKLLLSGSGAMLVSILAESGSAPRGAGAHMLVSGSGRQWGSIGGGSMEYQAEQLALQLLREQRSLVKEYHLSRDLGMICGGEATVFYQFIAASNAAILDLSARALQRIGEDKNLWLIVRLAEGGEWQMGLYSREEGPECIRLDGKALQACLKQGPCNFQQDGATYYVEPLHYAGRVVIFGGGHVAQALTPLLTQLGFTCWVMDDRAEYATAALFPAARRVLCGSYEEIGAYLSIQPADYVVVMTHGHASDYIVQKQAMAASPAYIGVIGSKNKVKTLNEKLALDGYSAAEIARVHAPIGLAIQAETPAEIAVSIAAQLIQVRAENRG